MEKCESKTLDLLVFICPYRVYFRILLQGGQMLCAKMLEGASGRSQHSACVACIDWGLGACPPPQEFFNFTTSETAPDSF